MDLSALQAAGISVDTSLLDRDAYRRDLWPRGTLALREGDPGELPAAVLRPTSDAQVAQIVAWAAEHGVAMVPWGAGSGVCGAAGGRAGSVVVDLKRMNRVLQLDTDSRTVRAQPGIIGQHLEDWLARRGWMTAHSPSSIMCSTLGGYVAARSAGQFSSRYGVFEDMLLATRSQSPSGELRTGTWTPQGAEDLLPIVCGSEGALGVITEALVRVVELPEHRWLRGYAFPDLPSAWEAMRKVMQAGLWPSVVRLYDPVDTRLAGKTQPKSKHAEDAPPGHPILGRSPILTRIRKAVEAIPALRHRVLDVPLALPGLVNRLAEGMAEEVLLILGFEGPTDLVRAQVDAAVPMLKGGRDLGPEPGVGWFHHRHDVSYKAAPIFVAGAFADTMEVAATWSRLPALHDAVRAALSRHAFVMAHFSHVYPEGCSIYFSFAGVGRIDVYDAAWTEALAAARDAGGTVTHHHGVGVLKAEAAAREAGAAVRVWRELKSRHDPTDICNPGRLFPSDVSVTDGPPPPQGGPVFHLDEHSRLAQVDPHAAPDALHEALLAQGMTWRIRPDRPLAEWLRTLRRGSLEAWETPLFGIQARFDDGVSVALGPAPRSAAGPDLRWSLLRRARPEMVEIPVRRAGQDMAVRIGAEPPIALREVRPAWQQGRTVGLDGPAASDVAGLLRGRLPDAQPARTPDPEPTSPWPAPSEDT